MDTRKIIHQLDESHSDEEFEGFTLGKGFYPNKKTTYAKLEGHDIQFFDCPENPDYSPFYEIDRPVSRTLILPKYKPEDAILKSFIETAHAQSKRKKIG